MKLSLLQREALTAICQHPRYQQQLAAHLRPVLPTLRELGLAWQKSGVWTASDKGEDVLKLIDSDPLKQC